MTFPTCSYVLGTLVVVESLEGSVEEALAVAGDYMDRVRRISEGEAKFVRALWFVKSPYEPGVLMRGGVFASPRCFGAYTWRGHAVRPWYFAREF